MLAETQQGTPLTPEIMQHNWSVWRTEGLRWPIGPDAPFTGIGTRVVGWWGPISILCPSDARPLADLVAFRAGLGDFGVVEDDARGSWSIAAREELGHGPNRNPRFRVEVRNWWAEPAGFFFCGECEHEQYALTSPTPLDASHHRQGDPHPGYTTKEPPLDAYVVLACRTCREHIVPFRRLGKRLFQRTDRTYQLAALDLVASIPD